MPAVIAGALAGAVFAQRGGGDAVGIPASANEPDPRLP